jgi:penicillin-binding protein 2
VFERRLKILLGLLVTVTAVLLLRSLQLQVLDRDDWKEVAIKINTRPELIDSTRGEILDRKNRRIAINLPCIDACVDYRAIVMDKDWLTKIAQGRLTINPEYSPRLDPQIKQKMLDDELDRVRRDIDGMWQDLAVLGHLSPDQLDDIRQSIMLKVQMRRRYLWYVTYEQALQKHQKLPPSPWYRGWILDDTQRVPELDNFVLEVAEQSQPHVILEAISNEVNNFLGKRQERYPGLVLRPSIRRSYPYGDAAAHVIGQLAHVSPKEMDDPNVENDLRQYLRGDLVGRSGLEALCEPLLRGTRGRVEWNLLEKDRFVRRVDPTPGIDVHTTIDIELQRQIQKAFQNVTFDWVNTATPDVIPMNGAAVVIDVASGEVLALASNPSYDLNTYDENYSTLARDYVNRPLLNRATQFALEPGSTVKPMVGIGAITQGIFPADGTIECKGHLWLDGKEYKVGRCWVATMFESQLGPLGIMHHQIPLDGRHPTGFLTFADGLERSCNVVFETLADRMGMRGLRDWYGRFGLGRPTGIGIAETSGSIPNEQGLPVSLRRSATWFAGIGQGQVRATPLQMANVAATIARDGIWMRPHLVPSGTEVVKPKTEVPDRVDLHLSPIAVQEAKQGMTNVVNSRAGTGQQIQRTDMIVAGKTGTAQAATFKIPVIDENGQIVRHKVAQEVDGQIKFVERDAREEVILGSHEKPNPLAPWYRGSGAEQNHITHAWFIGFAPANNPKIAFAVFVEYGPGGGSCAGSVARQVLDACVREKYLP